MSIDYSVCIGFIKGIHSLQLDVSKAPISRGNFLIHVSKMSANGDSAVGKRKMVGFDQFMANRTNPMTDKFDVRRFHHLEFWCSDATQSSHRFTWGMGMPLVAKSDMSTGNTTYCSHVLKSDEIVFVFTAP